MVRGRISLRVFLLTIRPALISASHQAACDSNVVTGVMRSRIFPTSSTPASSMA